MIDAKDARVIFEQRANRAKDNVKSFVVKFEKSPLEALKWINGPCRDAVDLEVFGKARQAVMDIGKRGSKISLESICLYAREQVDRLVSSGAPQSTAFLEGVLQAEEARAWNAVANILEGKL